MKVQYSVIALIVLGIVLIVMAYTWHSVQTFSDNAGTTVAVGGKSVSVEFARTPNEWARGLMDRESLGKNSAMLFEFSATGIRTFWNQRTLIPIDIIWIRDDRVVGVSQLPRVQDRGIVEVSSPEPVNFVLEVNAGWAKENNIQVGAYFHR